MIRESLVVSATKQRRPFFLSVGAILALGVLLTSAQLSQAANNFWQGGVGGDWGVDSNWSENRLPDSGDRAFINANDEAIISGGANEASRVLLADDAGTSTSVLTMNDGSLTIAPDGRLDLGTLGHGIFNINGGTLNAGQIRFGADVGQADAQGTMTITDGVVILDGDVVMGYGDATTKLHSLTMSGGSLTANRFFVADNAGSTARVDMTDGVINVNRLGIVTNIDACCPDLTGHFQLDGGAVNVLNPTDPTQGTGGAPVGFRIVNDGLDHLGTMDITGGTLVLAAVGGEEADVAAYLQGFVDQGVLTGYGGPGKVLITPGTEQVTVTAVIPEPATLTLILLGLVGLVVAGLRR